MHWYDLALVAIQAAPFKHGLARQGLAEQLASTVFWSTTFGPLERRFNSFPLNRIFLIQPWYPMSTLTRCLSLKEKGEKVEKLT